MANRILTSIATLGILGHSRFIPGTVGSLLGTIFSYFLFKIYGCFSVLVIGVGLVLFAVYACSAAERTIGCRDPSSVILDEFAAMPLCFLFLQSREWPVFLLGFLIFRVFDILKPLGIKFFEKFRGGWGIVLDDVVAACYTNVVLRMLLYLVKCRVKADF